MKRSRVIPVCLVILAGLVIKPVCRAQWAESPETGSVPERLPNRTFMAGQTGLRPLLRAELADADKNAKQHKAAIQVETDGVEIVDPAQANYAPRLDQGHFQYQKDSDTAINTTATSWTFVHLSPGEHYFRVRLAGNDNHPESEDTTLKIHIP